MRQNTCESTMPYINFNCDVIGNHHSYRNKICKARKRDNQTSQTKTWNNENMTSQDRSLTTFTRKHNNTNTRMFALVILGQHHRTVRTTTAFRHTSLPLHVATAVGAHNVGMTGIETTGALAQHILLHHARKEHCNHMTGHRNMNSP